MEIWLRRGRQQLTNSSCCYTTRWRCVNANICQCKKEMVQYQGDGPTAQEFLLNINKAVNTKLYGP